MLGILPRPGASTDAVLVPAAAIDGSLSWRRLAAIAIWVLVAVGVASYLGWPLRGDGSTHLAGIHQAIVSGRGLGATWNFRGPTYNLYLFGLYHLAGMFVPFTSVLAFDTTVKALHLFFFFWCSVGASIGLSRRVRGFSKLDVPLCGLFLVAYLSSHNTFWLHAEDVGLLLVLAAAGLATTTGPALLVLAGAVASLLPMLKGVTAPLCLLPSLALLLDRPRPGRAIAWYCMGLCASVAAQAVVFTQLWTVPVRDLLEAAVYQNSGHATWSERIDRFWVAWPRFLEGTPMFAVALGVLPSVLVQLLSGRRFTSAALLLAGWAVPVAMVLVQDKLFRYQFGCVAFAAVLTLVHCLAIQDWSRSSFAASISGVLLLALATHHPYFLDHVAMRLVFLGSALAMTLTTWQSTRAPHHPASEDGRMLLAALSLTILMLFWGDGLSLREGKGLKDRVARQVARYRASEARLGLTGETVLTLAYGSRIRLTDVKSACRHFFPIPVQRFRREDRQAFEAAAGFVENKDCIFNYAGRHVLLQEKWLKRSDLLRKLKRHLERRYRRVGWLDPAKEIAVWERR